MGDSITEGTVIEWTKSIGDQVNADDVVAVIETDKVSVDIRAPSSGTLKAVLAQIEDTVEVGQDLLVLDTEGAPAAAAAAVPVVSLPPPTAPTKEVDEPSLAATASEEKAAIPAQRVPMIKFLGKRSLLPPSSHGGLRLFDAILSVAALGERGSSLASPPPVPSPPVPQPTVQVASPQDQTKTTDAKSAQSKTSEIIYADFLELENGAMFGRPKFSDEEMESIDLGGDLPENW